MKLYKIITSTTYYIAAENEKNAENMAKRAECLLTPPDSIRVEKINSLDEIPNGADLIPFGQSGYLTAKEILEGGS